MINIKTKRVIKNELKCQFGITYFLSYSFYVQNFKTSPISHLFFYLSISIFSTEKKKKKLIPVGKRGCQIKINSSRMTPLKSAFIFSPQLLSNFQFLIFIFNLESTPHHTHRNKDIHSFPLVL